MNTSRRRNVAIVVVMATMLIGGATWTFARGGDDAGEPGRSLDTPNISDHDTPTADHPPTIKTETPHTHTAAGQQGYLTAPGIP